MNKLVRILKPAFIIIILLGCGIVGCLGVSQDTNKKLFSSEVGIGDADRMSSASKTQLSLTSTPHNEDIEAVTKSGLTGTLGLGSKKPVAFSEKAKIKQIALELAEKFPKVKKMKICHDKKNSEWWLTLYEDLGSVLGLKQYVWKIDRDNADPFLIIKRIPKTSLDSHLKIKEENRVCQILDCSPKGWDDVLANSFNEDGKKNNVGTGGRANLKKSEKPTGKPSPLTNLRPEKVVRVTRSSAKAHPESRNIEANTKRHSSSDFHNNPVRSSISALISTGSAPAKINRSPKSATRKEIPLEYEGTKFVQASSGANALIESRKTAAGKGAIKTISDEQILTVQKTAKLIPTHSFPEPKIKPIAEKPQPAKTNSPTYFVFVYGSEMNHQELMTWLEANSFDESLVMDATPAYLENYDYVWNYFSPSRNGGAVNIEPRDGGKLYGLLLEIKDQALKAFDKKAGHPQYYSRGDHRMAVRRVNNDDTVHAWVYTTKPNRSGRRNIWPTPEYKQKILEAAIFWQFPVEYISKLNEWRTSSNSDQ